MSFPKQPRAVVTGAGSGLGRAFCLELARHGARVVASDISLASAESTVAEMRGGVGVAVRCDVAQLADVAALAEEAERRFGGVDLVINNAGVATAGRVGETPIEDWQWIVNINLWGVVHGCHVFAPKLRAQKSGHIINVASAAGLLCVPSMGAYSATKAAVIALSECMHGELAEDDVGVTVLCPTFFKTQISENARSMNDQLKAFTELLMRQSKLSAEDVARFALDTAQANELYALPHADGRWAWRLKRLVPAGFHKMVPRAVAAQTKRLGLDIKL